MNASNWIALVALLIPLMGGGAVVVAKLTRIAVAVQNHENRLNKANL